MIKWIISGVLIIFSLIFSILKSVWAGFIYLGVICLSLLCLYWIYIRVNLYILEYHKNFDKEFLMYKADKINSTDISSEDFENNKAFYVKKFKKSLRKDKLIDLSKIFFMLTLFIVCMITLIRL